MTDLALQLQCIAEVCDDIKELLRSKNTSYDGSAFRDKYYGGRLILAEEAIDVRITDKIKRLESNDPNFNGEDAEADLLGYLVLKLALKKVRQTTTPPKALEDVPFCIRTMKS